MDIDSPRETGSMPVDIDDNVVSCRQSSSHSFDSVKMGSPDSDWERVASDFHPGGHQLAGSIPPAVQSLPGADGSPHLMVLAPSSSSVTQLGETRPEDAHQRRRLAEQRRVILSSLRPSIENATPRKRKHTHGITDNDYISHDDTFKSGTDSRRGRVRPRLQEKEDAEFSPLLIIPPSRTSSTKGETISAFYFPPPVTEGSSSIRRYFPFKNPLEHGPRILQSSSLAGFDNLEDPKESGRPDPTNSFTEVALASTVATMHGRLSTLQDFWLPRPFGESERSFMDGVKVHERGLEVPPSFFVNGDRIGGLGASCAEQAGSTTNALGHSIRLSIREHDAPAVSPLSAMTPLEPASVTIYFDEPLCDSPDSIGSNEDWFGYPGSSRMQLDHGTCFYSTPYGQPDRQRR